MIPTIGVVSINKLWGVTSTEIDIVWEQVEPLIQRVIDWQNRNGGARSVMSDIYEGLKDRQYQLWSMADNGIISAICITEIVQMPTRKICCIFMTAGTGVNNWVHNLGTIEQWAKTLDCDAVELWGRKGWKRMLPDYKESMIVMEKVI